jgi:hypothetical protein
MRVLDVMAIQVDIPRGVRSQSKGGRWKQHDLNASDDEMVKIDRLIERPVTFLKGLRFGIIARHAPPTSVEANKLTVRPAHWMATELRA